jgi:capsular exopolysaccharide synthesis family protein
MSRIDRALRIAEGTAVVEDADRAEASQTTPHQLNDYPRERPVVRAIPARATGEPETTVLPTLPVVPPSRRQVPRPPPDADLRARLVTGGADAVSLEQYRRLAAVLHDAQVERGLKTVMITSAIQAEGKTLTTANLALTLSESYGRRVLVIDADLRWPALHAVFGLPNVRGLGEALRDPLGAPAMVEVSSRLTMMTAGQPGPTPLAGLSSERMGTLLQECAGRFDWVLVDTSPVGMMPDGQLLARLIGAVILVINAGGTPAATVERVVADLGPECILGTVLNRVEQHRIPEAGHYARYGYGTPAGDSQSPHS